MRKQSLLSGTLTSPGTPDYQNTSDNQKGWCSERVALPSASKRHIGISALMPLNSGRALPSKWDDAERWITSPVSGANVNKNLLIQPRRQQKSKSGPLGSPFSTGVLVPDCVQLHYGSLNGGVLGNMVNNENAMDRTANLPGWSDALSESTVPSSQDDKYDSMKDLETTVSRDISRRDMATQMSPTESQCSSPIGRLSFSTSPPTAEVKDLQVDNRATTTMPPVKNQARKTNNDEVDVKIVTSTWEITKPSTNLSKYATPSVSK